MGFWQNHLPSLGLNKEPSKRLWNSIYHQGRKPKKKGEKTTTTSISRPVHRTQKCLFSLSARVLLQDYGFGHWHCDHVLGLSIHCLLVGTHTQGLQFEVSSMVDPPFLGCLKLFGEAKINLRFLFGYLSSVDGSDFASFGVFEVENDVLSHQTELIHSEFVPICSGVGFLSSAMHAFMQHGKQDFQLEIQWWMWTVFFVSFHLSCIEHFQKCSSCFWSPKTSYPRWIGFPSMPLSCGHESSINPWTRSRYGRIANRYAFIFFLDDE